jgi:hypothetical protein
VPRQDQDHIRQEGLEPLGAEVVGGLPADLERGPEARAVPPGPGDPSTGTRPPPAPLTLTWTYTNS